MSDTLVPVTVLTGYLGAGKTTLLNRILSENHGRKYAVVVNEFGELGVDNDLVVDTDEEVFEMNNGCICCTVRGDLIRIVERTDEAPRQVRRHHHRDHRARRPGAGRADLLRRRRRPGQDAARRHRDGGGRQAPAAPPADSHEAEDQIAFADVIVLNKTDLVTPDELVAVEAQIRKINKFAKIHHAQKSNVPIVELLDQGAFDLNRVLAHTPDFLTDDEHEHNDDIASMSFEVKTPIDPEKFNAWIGGLLAQKGQDLLRTKGILAYKGDDRRFAFQAVHMIADGDFIGPWKDGDPRVSRLVFIGRNLNRPQLRRGFEGCAA